MRLSKVKKKGGWKTLLCAEVRDGASGTSAHTPSLVCSWFTRRLRRVNRSLISFCYEEFFWCLCERPSAIGPQTCALATAFLRPIRGRSGNVTLLVSGNDSGNHLNPMEPALPHWNRFMQVSLPDRFSVISNGLFDRYRSAPLSLSGPSDSKALHVNGTPAASPMDCSPRSCTSSLASPLVLIQPAEAPSRLTNSSFPAL